MSSSFSSSSVSTFADLAFLGPCSSRVNTSRRRCSTTTSPERCTYVKLLKYDGKSMAANKIAEFSNLDFATLSDFIDFVKGRKLHEMSFMGYGQAWKGCRHFMCVKFSPSFSSVTCSADVILCFPSSLLFSPGFPFLSHVIELRRSSSYAAMAKSRRSTRKVIHSSTIL